MDSGFRAARSPAASASGPVPAAARPTRERATTHARHDAPTAASVSTLIVRRASLAVRVPTPRGLSASAAATSAARTTAPTDPSSARQDAARFAPARAPPFATDPLDRPDDHPTTTPPTAS